MLSFLLESAFRSLVLGMVVWIALRLFRIKASQISSLAWTAVLLTSLTMPLLMPAMKLLMTRAPAAKWLPVAPPTLFLRPLSPEVVAPVPATIDWQAIVAVAYVAVATVFLLRLFSGVWKSRKLWKSSSRLQEPWASGMDVRVCPELGIPATYASTILLPSDWPEWSAFKRDAVLLHESSHVRRGDFYIHLLAGVHRAAFWFSPLAWWLQKRHLELAEAICDDAAIKQVNDRVSYAEILVDFAERGSRHGFVAVSMARGNTVERRVERILQETSIFPEASMIRRIVLIAAFVPLVGLATGTWLVEARPAVRLPAILRIPQQRTPPTAPPQPAAPAPPPATQGAVSEQTNLLAKWPDQEVPDIVTMEERDAFQKLTNDVEREQFINQFWLRRDATPETTTNEFREEYYRRIVQANERFTTKSGTPGWKTDRGRIFIIHGPADEVQSHTLGGTYLRQDAGGATRPSTFPFERWGYRHLEGLGNNIMLEFVDREQDGTYRLSSDPSEKDRLLNPTPNGVRP